MNTAVTSRLSRWVAGVIAVALVAGGSLIATTPAMAVDVPTVTITPSANVDPAVANTFTVTGAGFVGAGAANGAYLALGAASVWVPGQVPDAGGFISTQWVQPRSIVNGAFSATISAPAGSFDRAVDYGISTFAAHGLSITDRSLDTFTPFTVAALPATATATTLTAPATASVGAPVSLSATVTPTAPGNVEFFDGATSIATAPVASGTASTNATFATAGAHGITATFIPADAAAFVASTSAASVVTVSATQVPRVTISTSTVSSAGETITVTGSGFGPAGTATNATRPPLDGKFGGVYVTFGRFADSWKASQGASSGARTADRSTLKWVMNAEDTATVGGAAAGAVPIGADGTFAFNMLVKPGFSGAPTTGNYGIYTYPGGGVAYPAFETYTPITFASSVTATTTALIATPETVTAGNATALTAKVTPATAGTVTFTSGGTTVGVVPVDASGAATQVTPPIGAGTSTFTATFAPADPQLFAGSTGTVSVVSTPLAPSTASLDWGVKKSFRDYITGPIAHGSITTAGVTDNGGVYGFPFATGGSYDATTGLGTALYTGSLRFSGHDGQLDITFGDPRIRVTSPTTGTLSVNVDGGAPVAIATLDLSAATATSTADSKSFAGAPATLTEAGGVAFGGFYTAGAALDPVTFTIDTTVPAVPTDPTLPVEPQLPVQPEVPLAPVEPVAAPSVGAGSLAWGVKQSFRSYVTGPIAKGAVTTSGVASSGGIFTFGQAAGSTFDRATGVGTSNYSGSVRFTGHGGQLDVTLSNPVVRVDSASSGTLLVSVNGRAATPFATLNLAAASRSTPNDTVSYSGVPASLTSQGAAVFSLNGSGFYAVGSALDPVSFVVGAPSLVSSAVGATVASFTGAANTPAATPPATTGITIAQGTALKAGDEVTITASGFRPNETGILVVIYSTPTVLDTNATADATGTVTWTGRLPAELSGVHTLTFQGSVDRGVELTIEAAHLDAAVAGCVVDDATLTWGFKESFRAYISGSIANGEWTVADGASYAVPNFGFAAGTGDYDAVSGAGALAFPGSITFTGHGGVLNTTVSNPRVTFVDADTALLLLDVSGTTQDGAAIDNKAVEFAEIDLSGVIENADGAVTITAAPATLTEAGAGAIGTYPAGEALDPITIAFSTAADCAVPVADAAAPVTTSTEAISADTPTGWIVWAIVALIIVLAAVVVVVLVRRRKA